MMFSACEPPLVIMSAQERTTMTHPAASTPWHNLAWMFGALATSVAVVVGAVLAVVFAATVVVVGFIVAVVISEDNAWRIFFF